MLARIHKSMEERDEGFTLIELLVVIIIIGILAAIAIPVFLSQRNKGYDSQAKSDARNIATLEETYFNDNNTYTATYTNLDNFKKSGGVSAVATQAYSNTSPIAQAAAGKAGFCAQATSQSGTTFVYESWNGGLQPASGTGAVNACP